MTQGGHRSAVAFIFQFDTTDGTLNPTLRLLVSARMVPSTREVFSPVLPYSGLSSAKTLILAWESNYKQMVTPALLAKFNRVQISAHNGLDLVHSQAEPYLIDLLRRLFM